MVAFSSAASSSSGCEAARPVTRSRVGADKAERLPLDVIDRRKGGRPCARS
jgi:hypothetical protein